MNSGLARTTGDPPVWEPPICTQASSADCRGIRLNFVTSVTMALLLWDLVSFNRKHNLANGENDRDGMNENVSWNCGVEGPTSSARINALRRRQAKNLVATLLLSQGVPMLLAGDEFLRTQQGNNNAWCQDNELAWVDWTLAEQNAGFLRFVPRGDLSYARRHPRPATAVGFFRGSR